MARRDDVALPGKRSTLVRNAPERAIDLEYSQTVALLDKNQRLEQQTAELNEAASLVGKTGDRTITAKELGTVMRSRGRDQIEAELHDIIDEVYADGGGAPDFSECVSSTARNTNGADTEEELIEAMKVVGRDDNGFISAAELLRVITNLQNKLTDEEVDEVGRRADVEEDDFCNRGIDLRLLIDSVYGNEEHEFLYDDDHDKCFVDDELQFDDEHSEYLVDKVVYHGNQFNKVHDHNVECNVHDVGPGHYHMQSNSQRLEDRGGGTGGYGHNRVPPSWQHMRGNCVDASCIELGEQYHPMGFLEPRDLSALAAVQQPTPATTGLIQNFLARWTRQEKSSLDLLIDNDNDEHEFQCDGDPSDYEALVQYE